MIGKENQEMTLPQNQFHLQHINHNFAMKFRMAMKRFKAINFFVVWRSFDKNKKFRIKAENVYFSI